MKNLKCPVCGWDIKDEGKKALVDGKPVVVCCDECVTELARTRAKPAERR